MAKQMASSGLGDPRLEQIAAHQGRELVGVHPSAGAPFISATHTHLALSRHVSNLPIVHDNPAAERAKNVAITQEPTASGALDLIHKFGEATMAIRPVPN